MRGRTDLLLYSQPNGAIDRKQASEGITYNKSRGHHFLLHANIRYDKCVEMELQEESPDAT